MNKIIKMKVNGMHCSGCANKIKTSLNQLNADQKVEVYFSTGEVKVEFNNDKASLFDIKTAITSAGFSVESVEIE